jgi:hypothetical protein
MTRRFAATGLATAVTVASSLAGVAVLGAGSAGAQAVAGWHVLVYAVNDSTSDLPLGLDLDEMINASRSGVNFSVYMDSSDASAPDFHSQTVQNEGGAAILEISGGTATVTQRMGELDSGSPDTLGWFVATSLLAHPAERTAFVAWDHGSGWQGIAFDEDVTASGDYRNTSALDAAELGSAMEAGLAAAGREQFDIIALDACLMANFEIVSELHGNAQYLISSEELVPGLGLNYDSFSVFANPAADIATIFDTLADGFVADIEQDSPLDSDMMTLSLIDLDQAPNIDAALSTFALAAAADVTANPQPYLDAAGQVFKYGDTGDYWAGFVDLGEYLHVLTTADPAVVSARDSLLATIDAAVLDQIGTESYAAATGLTVYLPNEPREYDASYEQQPAAQFWRPFLTSFYDAQAQVVLNTDIGFTAEAFSVAPAGDGYYAISAPVTANFNGSVELLAALPAADGTLNFFETDSGFVENGSATAELLPSLTTISDGINSAVPFTRYVLEDDGWHGYSQFTLQRSDGSIANLNWDRSEQDTGPLTIIDPSGVVVGYTPTPGDLAYPIVMVQTPGAQPERQATAPALDLNVPWTVSDELIPNGTQVYVELQIKDAAGVVVDSLSGYLTAGQ